MAFVIPHDPLVIGGRSGRRLGRRPDEHVLAVDPYVIDLRTNARASIRSAGAQVERPAVTVTRHRTFDRLGFGQRQPHVRACIAHGEHVATDAEHSDARALDHDHAPATLAEFVQAADPDPVAHQSNWM